MTQVVEEWVFDVRDRAAYAAEHVHGGIGVEPGEQLGARVAALLPEGGRFVLAGSDAGEIGRAAGQLEAYGLRPERVVVGPPAPGTALATYPRATFRDLSRARRERGETDLLGWDDEPFLPVVVLDVRETAEFAAGHLRGAVHVPLYELPDHIRQRVAALPETQPKGVLGRLRAAFRGRRLPPPGARTRVWVHCADGSRASVAAGVLERSGYEVTCLDDDLAAAATTGVVRLTSSF
ncbi:hypothetical protein KIH74_24825 [Kineosporia sp. J2-2]|uniref:Rhodanese domain-containing protein n=1 Tax=Kineosporia corallincola TaxID=2835133 RepID=A0ABS5TM81_9ACTN|nr:rhodanese-like domain-containing protein [Kineosporia corallincola]MBT0772192.1 hypothetical protein [Kineosporia corallincola]